MRYSGGQECRFCWIMGDLKSGKVLLQEFLDWKSAVFEPKVHFSSEEMEGEAKRKKSMVDNM